MPIKYCDMNDTQKTKAKARTMAWHRRNLAAGKCHCGRNPVVRIFEQDGEVLERAALSHCYKHLVGKREDHRIARANGRQRGYCSVCAASPAKVCGNCAEGR